MGSPKRGIDLTLGSAAQGLGHDGEASTAWVGTEGEGNDKRAEDLGWDIREGFIGPSTTLALCRHGRMNA
jgi:hypothetical protein